MSSLPQVRNGCKSDMGLCMQGPEDDDDGATKCEQQLQFQARLTELVHLLNRCNNSAGAFGIFVDAMERMFPALSHISLLLLPTIKQPGGAVPPSSPIPPPANPLSSSTNARRSGKQSRQASTTTPAASQNVPVGGLAHGGTEGPPDIEWPNTCLFHLYKGRGAVVQPHPEWPLVCSAAYHAATAMDGVLSTPNYRQIVRSLFLAFGHD